MATILVVDDKELNRTILNARPGNCGNRPGSQDELHMAVQNALFGPSVCKDS